MLRPQSRRLVPVRIALLALTLVFVGSATGASTTTVAVGDQNIEASHDSNTAGRAEAFRTSAIATGPISKLTVYVDSTSPATKLTAGLYANANGHPGALLGQGTVSAPVKGAWNDVPIGTVQITSGTVYWIALLSPTGTGTLQFRDAFGTGASETSSSGSLASMPATWTTGTVYPDGSLSAYAVIDTASQQPILLLSPTNLSFSGQAGSAQPATASVSLTNGGGGTFSFAATSDSQWLTVSPGTGGPPQSLQLTASFANLSAGSYTGHVQVDAGAIQGSPGTITVTLSVAQPSTPSPLDWPTVDQNPARTGEASGETTITTSNVANLKSLWSTTLDGKVTAEPLFLKQVTVGGQLHDVVIAATNANSVYALDAGTGAVLWRKNLGAVASNCAIPGGFGITAAPVVDKVNGLVYTVSDDGFLHTLSLGTGTDATTAVQVVAQPSTNKVWGGLNLVGSNLYIATASDGCDTPPWRGRIYDVSVSGATPQVASTFDVVPGIAAPNGGGGIWGYGGVSVDPAGGQVFAATGADSNETYTAYADRIVEFDSTLSLLGSFLPSEPGTFPCSGAPCDLDFGATPIVFQPPGCPVLTAAGNKNGVLYLSKESDLATSAPPLQSLQLNAANDWLGSGGIGGVPAYWSAGNMLFVSDVGSGFGGAFGGIVGLSIQPDCTLKVAWSATLGGNATPDSTPTVANGVVYVGEGDTGAVHAFDAQTGAHLWSSGAVSGSSVYAAPIVADGKLIFGSWNGSSNSSTGTIRAYAPGAPDTTPPTVSITAPANNATVSGTVAVTANAGDDVGVASVQFKLDGVNLGNLLTSGPYTVSWDTTTATAGNHTLTAVAKDAAGNTTTSTAVTVNVDNSAPPPGVVVGDQTIEAQLDQNTPGRAEAFRIAATATGAMTQLTVYIDSTSTATKVVVGIYSNNGTHPGTRLTEGTITAPVKGAWNTVSVPSASITSGTTYWMAILGPTGAGTVKFRDKAGGSSETSASGSLTDLPATWSTGTHYSDGPLSAYGGG